MIRSNGILENLDVLNPWEGSFSGAVLSTRLKYRDMADEGFMINEEGHFTTVDGVSVRKLFIGNLAKTVTEKDLFASFNRYGKILQIFVVKSTQINNRPTFGFVTFEDPQDATSALQSKNRIFIKSRRVFVSPADSWHQPVMLANGELCLNTKRREDELAREEENPDPELEEADVSINEIELVKPDESSPVSKLNDDCLLMIFDMLHMKDRLALHKVCRRWQLLLNSIWYNIKKLDFANPSMADGRLTDAHLKTYLSVCPNLTSLNLAVDVHRLASNALVIIAQNCPSLEELAIRDLRVKKRSLAYFGKTCKNLKSFSSDVCSMTLNKEMVSLLKNSENLENICMRYSSNSPGHWLKLISTPLKSLTLELYDFNADHLMEGLRNAKDTLRELKLVTCESIRCRDISRIVSIVPDLTHFTLSGGSFTDYTSYSLIPITTLKNLVHLDLDNTEFVSDQFLSDLHSNCPNLQTLILSGIEDKNLTNNGLSILSQFSGLTSLTLLGTKKLTDSMLRSISQKIKGLKHLSIVGCSSITDSGCQSVVTNCKELETLDVSSCKAVTELTIIAAAECLKGTDRKLKITVGDSGIDADISCPPSITLNPLTTMMARHPDTMFIIGPAYGLDEREFLDFPLDDDDLDDISVEDYGDCDWMQFDHRDWMNFDEDMSECSDWGAYIDDFY